ncbi:MAG: hypothetical protein LBT15_05480 [Synergistaceae bacterium]|jgi:hypothetical protein|nr:hypothetical protein [Synergistaceae bacterium]
MGNRARIRRVIALLALCFLTGATDVRAEVYVNPKFGYGIDVPDDLFEVLPESASDDGRVFVSRKDPEVRIRFFAAAGVTEVPNALKSDVPPGVEKADTTPLDRGYFLRYKKDGVAFVSVRRLEDDVLYSALFECPVEKTGDYDAICRTILATWSLPEE